MTGGKFKLKKSYRRALNAAADEARKHGAMLSYQLAGRHPTYTVWLGADQRTSPFSSTPRAGEFQVTFVRQRVRQMIKEMTE